MDDGDRDAGHAIWRRVEADGIADFVERTLYAPERELPVVAVTTSRATGRPWVDLDALAGLVGDRAQLVLIETGGATTALAEALPPRLEVFGGAVRIWWPGLGPEDVPFDHPLYFARSASDGRAVVEQVGAALAAGQRGEGSREAWARFAEDAYVGDVVQGRVHRILDKGVLVELQPGVIGLVHISELDWTFVERPESIVRQDEIVDVEVLSLDVAGCRADLSVKRALGRVPREPGGRAPGAAPGTYAGVPAGAAAGAAATDEPLQARLAVEQEERARLQRRVRELERTLRSERDSAEAMRRRTLPETDPLSSEAAFLLGVRLAYARLYGEGERHAHPLGRMRVGPEFLARLEALQGLSVEKVLEVCAQVAAGTAHMLPGREVHQLHTGPGGSPVHVRARDGAKAWRCSLQDGTASARRLHWWVVPGDAGGAVEFASVGVHDDMTIPE